MFRIYKTEGIVIRRINFSESDKLVTIFTKNRGKIIVLAKGVRKISSKKAPHLELFNKIVTSLAKGRNFDILLEAETVASYPLLSSDLTRLAHGYRIIEVLDKLYPEGEVHFNVYSYLLSTLSELNDIGIITDISLITSNFIHKLLWESGYLAHDKTLSSEDLEGYLEEIIERSLKSSTLLTKLKEKV